jgi:hypothetical protein
MMGSVATIWRENAWPTRGRALCGLKELAACESDDGFDFPPTAYPGRELVTASLFGLVVMTFVVWVVGS